MLFGETPPFASAKDAAAALVPYIEREMARRARGCTPSRAMCTACSAPFPARALFAGILPARGRQAGAGRSSVLLEALALRALDTVANCAHRGLNVAVAESIAANMLLGVPLNESSGLRC